MLHRSSSVFGRFHKLAQIPVVLTPERKTLLLVGMTCMQQNHDEVSCIQKSSADALSVESAPDYGRRHSLLLLRY